MSTAAFQSRADLQHTHERRQHLARVQTGLEEIYALRFNGKVLRPSEATATELINMCAEYAGTAPEYTVPSGVLMLEIFKYQRPVFTERLGPALVDVSVLRDEIIGQILALWEASGKSLQDMRSERTRLSNGFTLQKLRNHLSYLTEARRLARKSVPELKQDIQVAREAAQPLQELFPAEITSEDIRRAPVPKIQYWLKRYGAEQVNARLQGR